MELLIVLVLFTPVLLIGAGLEWLSARKPTWAGIKFYVSDWDDLELGVDGHDSQMAVPPLPRLVHGHESADSTSVSFPQGPLAGGVSFAGHAHDAAGHQNSHACLGGHGHEAVSLEMFGGQSDGA